MINSKIRMKRSRNGSSPNKRSRNPRMEWGTPQASGVRLWFASNLTDRLMRISGHPNPRYIIRLAKYSLSYRELIRRYSNDSML